MNYKRGIFLIFIFVISFYNVNAFAPDPASPIAQGIHPRLHITPDNLEEMRVKMAGPNKAAYQSLIDKVVAGFSLDTLPDDSSGLAADYHALIYLLGPISGIDYKGKSINDFGARAIAIMMNFSSKPVDCYSVNQGGADFHGYPHNYANIARTYDWMWHYPGFTNAQKQTVVNVLAQSSGCMVASNLFSSHYHAFYLHPYYMGLAFYGDGFADEDARLAAKKFEQHMLNGGALDAQNFISQKKGGPDEVGAYSYGNGHGNAHTFYLDGWRTATGIDYFSTGTQVADAAYSKGYPRFLAYIKSPWDGYRLLKWGQMSVNDWAGGSDGAMLLNMLTGPLKNSDPNMANLAKFLGSSFDVNGKPTPQLFQYVLLSDQGVPSKTPSQLGLSLTEYFEGLGIVFARSGFENKDDLAFVVGGPPYNYEGHSWDRISDLVFGFQLDKYGGPLIFKKVAYHRNGGSTHRQNQMRFTDPATASTDISSGLIVNSFSGNDIRTLNPNSPHYRGGVERYLPLTNLGNGKFDYIYTDIGRFYDPSRVKTYTRQYFLVRPNSWEQSDYIIIFDRVEASKPEIIKRWLMNIAYDPVINGVATPVREGKTTYNNADQVMISNNGIDPYYGCPDSTPICNKNSFNAHGRAFVKTLLPSQVKIDKIGGPYHEFEDDIGNVATFSDHRPFLKGYGAFYVGAYTLEVIPTQNNQKENFLHVIQTADANLVSEMVQTTLIESTEGKMQGTYITKTIGQDNTVVMFSKNEEVLDLASQTITYRYGAGQSGTTRHIISDLKANHQYTITDRNVASGATTNQVISTTDLRTDFAKQAVESAAGILSFTTNANAEHEITITQQGPSVSFAPSIYLSPNRFSALPPANIILTALANDQDGAVGRVEFYNGVSLLNTDLVAPYTYTWPNIAAGNYTISAKAYDNLGVSTASNSFIILIGVNSDIIPPTISLTSPIANSLISPDATITISASASDSNNNGNTGIVKVDFKIDNILIGIDTTSPYSITWLPLLGLAAGNHMITAETIDGAGNKRVSNSLPVLYSQMGISQLPVGTFESISALGVMKGWTYDPDNSADFNRYLIYIDNPIGQGTLLVNTTTNIGRSDINTALGITGSHGFNRTVLKND